MTRKDYELIARAINKTMNDEYIGGAIIDIFIKELAAANPNFDVERFRTACLIG